MRAVFAAASLLVPFLALAVEAREIQREGSKGIELLGYGKFYISWG